MQVISLKDYAKDNNISYEAVRQQVVRYKDDLGPHIIKDGRQQFLDEEAVAFLDSRRMKNPVAIIQMDKDDAIEQLRKEKEELLKKVVQQADQIAALLAWKAENAVAIAEVNQTKMLLTAAEGQNKEKDTEIARLRQVANERLQEAQKAADELVDERGKVKTAEKAQKAAEDELAAEKARKISLKEYWRRRKGK